jgi:alpha-galactosidase
MELLGMTGPTRTAAPSITSAPSSTIQRIWSSLSLRPRDLYAKADRGTFTSGYAVDVPGHGCAMLKVVGRP